MQSSIRHVPDPAAQLFDACQAARDLFRCEHDDIVDLIDAAVRNKAPSDLQNWQVEHDGLVAYRAKHSRATSHVS